MESSGAEYSPRSLVMLLALKEPVAVRCQRIGPQTGCRVFEPGGSSMQAVGGKQLSTLREPSITTVAAGQSRSPVVASVPPAVRDGVVLSRA